MKDNNLISLTIYLVSFHTSNSSDILYHGTDADKAKLRFNSNLNISEKWLNRTDMSLHLQKQTNQYRFIHELDTDYETIKDYPIELYYNDNSIYEIVHEGDWEYVECRKIDAANSDSNKLLQDVEYYYKQKYGNYKYNNIDVYDKDDNYKGCIRLRIADHTENINNVHRFGVCDYHISVVVADYDTTKQIFEIMNLFERRKNQIEVCFNKDDDFNDVIKKINNLIEKFKQELLSKGISNN